MKLHRLVFAIATLILTVSAALYSQEKAASQTASAKPFIGRWDLTLKAPDKEYPSWLELSEEGDQLNAQMVGRWGNARPLPRIEVTGGELTFVSPKEEEESKEDLTFKGKLSAGHLAGTLNGPDGKQWSWTGVRAPSLRRSGTPKWGKPIELFNGKDLTGWHASKQGSPEWKVEDGNLVTPGNGPELINDSKFEDFKLHVEFNIGENANSGVYLRGRYEVQIENESAQEPPSHHTGGVYGFLAPTPELPRKANEWESFDITLIGRNVTVVQNGTTVIDNKEIPGITGGALDSHEGQPGPIYLQGSEKGHVKFRKIEITPAQK
jgi:hypothetical protein